MKTNKVVSLQRHRLSREPVVYTIEFRHDGDGFSFTTCDVENTEKDRLAIAADLEDAATILREPRNKGENE